jgi:hypothetical protein
MGGPKAPMVPPMNSGVALSASPVNCVAATPPRTQAGDGIFDRFAAGVNAFMGTGTFEVGESSRGSKKVTNKARTKMFDTAMGIGLSYDEATRLTDDRLKKFIMKNQ